MPSHRSGLSAALAHRWFWSYNQTGWPSAHDSSLHAQANDNQMQIESPSSAFPMRLIWRCFKSVLSLEKSTMVPLNLRLKKHKKQITVALLSMVWTFLFHYPSVEQLFNIQYMSLQPTRAEQDLPHVQAFGVALENLHMRSAMRSRLSARLMKSHPAPCFKNPHILARRKEDFRYFRESAKIIASICFVNLQEGNKDEQGTISEANVATPKSKRLETGDSFDKLLYLVRVERQGKDNHSKTWNWHKLTSLKFNAFCIQQKMYCKVDHTIILIQKNKPNCALRTKLRSFPEAFSIWVCFQ